MDQSKLDALARTYGAVEIGATLRRAALEPANVAALPSLSMGVAGADLEIVDVLGKGGMGVVLLARQRSLDRAIAIKRTASGASARDTSALLAEARATGALEHPNIVPVHALGTDGDGAPLFVMKRIEGASLAALIETTDHPAWPDLERRHGGRIEAYVEILMRVADALHFAHRSGFIHRDVKPANVMVGAFGEVYLLDWGVAVRGDASGGDVVGTPAYMAPEMLDGDADARTDVYLLGATLHTILTGEPRHDASSFHAVLVSAFESKPYPYDASVPAELAEIANRATHKDPSARFATALAMRDALGAFLRHRGSMRLVERAEEILASQTSSRALVEARFALTQALREWADNAAARALLRRTLIALANGELDHKNAGGAADVLAEIDPPEPALEARIAKVRAEIAEAAALAERARIDERERDPTVGGRTRVALTVMMIALMVGGGSVLFILGILDASFVSVIASDLTSIAFVLALGAIFRKKLFANRFGRQLAALVLLISLGLLISHVADWLLGAELTSDAQGLAVIGTGVAVAAVTLAPRFGIAAASSWTAALIAATWPAASAYVAVANLLVSAGVIIAESWERQRPRAA